MILSENRYPLFGIMLLVRLAGAEAEADAVTVAEMAAVHPLISDTAALVGRIMGIAAADLPADRLPQAVDHQPGAGQDRGAVGQMHGAQHLAGELPALRRPAQRHPDQLAAKFVDRHRLRCRGRDGQHKPRDDEGNPGEASRMHGKNSDQSIEGSYNMDGSTRSGGRWPSMNVRMLMITFSPMSTRPSMVA